MMRYCRGDFTPGKVSRGDFPIRRGSPWAPKLQRRVLGVHAEPHPALTRGAMKHTRPFIARRPGPRVTGETAPGVGPIVLLLLPLLLIDRPSTESGSRNPKRTMSSSVGGRGARAAFATAVPGCGWQGRINCHRPGPTLSNFGRVTDSGCEGILHGFADRIRTSRLAVAEIGDGRADRSKL